MELTTACCWFGDSGQSGDLVGAGLVAGSVARVMLLLLLLEQLFQLEVQLDLSQESLTDHCVFVAFARVVVLLGGGSDFVVERKDCCSCKGIIFSHGRLC